MRCTLLILSLSLAFNVLAQEPVIVIYSTVPDRLAFEVSLFLDAQPMYAAPLNKHKKLVYSCKREGTRVLLAKSLNAPNVRSATMEINVSGNDTLYFVVTALEKIGESGHDTIFLNDITDNQKQREKLNKKEFVAVLSRED
jgi:hypothetical protein